MCSGALIKVDSYVRSVSAWACLELGAGDLSERTQLEELEEDLHFVFR